MSADCAGDAFTEMFVISVTHCGSHAQPANTVELHKTSSSDTVRGGRTEENSEGIADYTASVPSGGRQLTLSADVNGLDVYNKAKRAKERPRLANKKMRKFKIKNTKDKRHEQGQAGTV